MFRVPQKVHQEGGWKKIGYLLPRFFCLVTKKKIRDAVGIQRKINFGNWPVVFAFFFDLTRVKHSIVYGTLTQQQHDVMEICTI